MLYHTSRMCAKKLANGIRPLTQHHPCLLLMLQTKQQSPKQQSPKQQSPKQSGAKLHSRTTSRTFSGLMADVPACLSFSDLSNSYPADFQSEYGPNHASRELVRTARRVVVKVQLHFKPCLLRIECFSCSLHRSTCLLCIEGFRNHFYNFGFRAAPSPLLLFFASHRTDTTLSCRHTNKATSYEMSCH